MFDNQTEAVQYLIILIESARIKISAQIQMNGDVLDQTGTVVSTYGHGEVDRTRWISVISAERRITPALADFGQGLVTEYGDLRDALHRQYCVVPGLSRLQ